MSAFLDTLDELAVQEPEMEQAVDNIRNDLRSDRHPYGISQELLNSLDKRVEDAIAATGSTSIRDWIRASLQGSIENGDDFWQVVDSHRSIEKPELHVEAEIQSVHMRRVMSLHSFFEFHLKDSVESTGTFHDLYFTRAQLVIC